VKVRYALALILSLLVAATGPCPERVSTEWIRQERRSIES